MELPFEVLDYIFFLLRSDPETLVKCSKVHSLFPQIVNKHLFYHIVIHLAHLNLSTIVLSRPGFGYNLSVSELIKLVSETPRLIDHVRVLEIDFFDPHTYLEDLAAVLPAFSSLESITLMAWHVIVWANILSWSPSFKTAIKGCLHLPTMRELHIGDFEFPLSLLCTNSNINSLSLSGSSLIPDSSDHAFPQLNSLSIKHLRCSSLQSLSPWIKRHITDLQSLKCDSTDEDFILELLDTCSNTLRNLDIDLKTALRELGLPNSRCQSHIDLFSRPFSSTSYFRYKSILYGNRTSINVQRLAVNQSHLPFPFPSPPPSLHYPYRYIFCCWLLLHHPRCRSRHPQTYYLIASSNC